MAFYNEIYNLKNSTYKYSNQQCYKQLSDEDKKLYMQYLTVLVNTIYELELFNNTKLTTYNPIFYNQTQQTTINNELLTENIKIEKIYEKINKEMAETENMLPLPKLNLVNLYVRLQTFQYELQTG